MDSQKLIKAFCRIFGSIQRWLSTTVEGDAVPNGGDQPTTDASPEKSKSAEGVNFSQSPVPRETQPSASPTENSKPTKTPQKRSGKRGKQTGRKLPNQDTTPPEKKPELICRQVHAHNQWQILLVIPQGENINVWQEKSKLSPDNNDEYPLSNFTEAVNSAANSGHEIIELFDGKSPLIFKLRKNWKGDGRLVGRVSAGYYVAFAPNSWVRTNNNPPVEPSGCNDQEFSAHYFFNDGNDKPDGFVGHSLPHSQKRFSLEGQTVADDSDMGDLFVGAPPELTDINDNDWQGVSWIRVGQEGGRGWGKNFKPDEEKLRQVLANREGWFYIRIYDDVKMIDSLAFRRLVNLEAILINRNPLSPENIIVPDTKGHAETTIQFVGKIQVKCDNPHIVVGNNNTAVVEPNPNLDKMQWTLIGNNGQVKVSIHLPRIWWHTDNTDDEVGEWRDTAFEMSRNQFYQNRDSLIVVRLPSVAKEICVGFDSFNQYDGARRYSVQHNHNDDTKQAEFKLRDFCNHTKISERSSKESGLRIQCGTAEFALVRIPADATLPKPKPPKLDPIPPQPEIFRPVTKNKRFSPAELVAAGWVVAEAKRLRIAVDHRRKTMHRVNIETLQKKQGKNHAD